MRNRGRLEAARMALTTAVTRSTAADRLADPDGRATQQHLFAAELKLRQGGRPDLARRLEAALTGDVTTPTARCAVREVAQKIDAELDPDVSTGSRPRSPVAGRLSTCHARHFLPLCS